MHLTTFNLNGSHPAVGRLLRDPASVRHFVRRLTDGMPAEPRVLWRVDDWFTPAPKLLLCTTDVPARLPVPQREPAQTVDHYPDRFDLVAGKWWNFRLTGNPVRSVATDGARGKIKAHTTPDHQAWWVDDKGERHGFWPSTVTELWQRYWRFSVPGAASSQVLQMTAYSGTLKVTDPELLRSALGTGIGRGKAYGCGLLTLHPRPEVAS